MARCAIGVIIMVATKDRLDILHTAMRVHVNELTLRRFFGCCLCGMTSPDVNSPKS